MPKSDNTNTANTSTDVRREKSKYLLYWPLNVRWITFSLSGEVVRVKSIFVVTYRARYRFIKAGVANTLKN